MDEPPERWEVRNEGPLLQGPALNALPAAMREVTDAACFGAGAVEFWKGLGGKFEYETYREGNEYHIVFQGHEIKVILATLHSLVEQHVLRDASSVRPVSGGLLLDVSCLVPEGQHAAGAHVVGAFGVLLSHYGVRLVRAEVPQGAAARRK